VTAEVAVTGVGAISALGGDVIESHDALVRGVCGIQARPEFAVPGGRPSLQAAVPNGTPMLASARELRHWDRATALAMHAARAAWAMAGKPNADPDRLAVSVSGCFPGYQSLMQTARDFGTDGAFAVTAGSVPRTMSNAPAVTIAIELGARCGTYAPVSACASGSDAIALGFRLIASNEADVVVVGGADAPLDPVMVAGFQALRALSGRIAEPHLACRPFDRARDGFVLGEGGAVLVLEALSFAQSRGATPIAMLRGVGCTSDGHHLVAPHPDGVPASNAMRKALECADVGRQEVTVVSAHATGTRAGDAAEAAAIARLLESHASEVAVTGPKYAVGHTLGASGALAAVLACRGLVERTVAPIANFTEPDPGVSLDIVQNGSRTLSAVRKHVALVNSFGFGGQNVSLCLSQY
jgi:3-oxoacyl-[acyl-carrier-protein] synthase II